MPAILHCRLNTQASYPINTPLSSYTNLGDHTRPRNYALTITTQLTMTSTTPNSDPQRRTRSKSPRSRPTTPLRPSSRSSLRDSAQRVRGPYTSSTLPLELLQEDFAELSDAMADLESNFMQLQLMHESLARFSESFAGFLYGMNMNAFCVDFPEVRLPPSPTRQITMCY